MTIIHFVLIIAAIILFHMLVDTLTSWSVFGPILSEEKLDKFFKEQALEWTDIDYSGDLLHWIKFKHKHPEKTGVNHSHFIAKHRTGRLLSKYWIDEIGQVDRWSKWSRKIDRRYAELSKQR